MPDTPEQIQVLKAIRDTLQTIVKGDEYHFTLQNRVHIGRPIFDREDEVPFVSILEVPIPPEQMKTSRGGSLLAGPWELFIQGFVEETADRDDKFLTKDAYCLKQDVTRRLLQERRKVDRVGAPDPMFGSPCVDNFEIGRGVVRPDEERSKVCFFWIPLTINLIGG